MRLILLSVAALAAAPALAGAIDRPAPSLTLSAPDDAGSTARLIAADAGARDRALAPYAPRQTAYGLTMVLPDTAFAADSLRGDRPLADLAAYVRTDPAIRLRVTSHADLPTPAAAARARGRAQAVTQAIAAAGVTPDRIERVDEGTDRPLAEGTDPAARARNRRVEITLLGEQAAPLVAMR